MAEPKTQSIPCNALADAMANIALSNVQKDMDSIANDRFNYIAPGVVNDIVRLKS